jgi:hypothetical protein
MEVDACVGHADSDPCFVNGDGVCKLGACAVFICGDGVKNGKDSCDGSDLGGATCASLGFYGQTMGLQTTGLACASDCTFDKSGCVGACGDHVKNGPELCDGTDLGGADCRDAGFYDGPGLACSPFCTFDVTACTGFCGDWVVNGPEICDGRPPGASTCLDYGFDHGFLGCSAICGPAFDTCGSFGWEKVAETPTTASLERVFSVSPTEAYAVGLGTILQWDGKSWTPAVFRVANPSVLVMNDVWASGPGDVWAVGGENGGQSGIIVHYDGHGWGTRVSGGPPFAGIWGSASNDVYAFGADLGGDAVDIAYHWNGATWTPSPTGIALGGTRRRAWGSGPKDIYVVGSQVIHWDGTIWSTVDVGMPQAIFTDVWGSASDDVFIVGWGGAIVHGNRTSWTAMRSGISGTLWGVWGRGPNDVLAVGDDVLHWDGASWRVMAASTGYLSVSGTPSGDAFAAGYPDPIARFVKTGWTAPSAASPTGVLDGVWGSGSGDVHVVGDGGISRWDGQAWATEDETPGLKAVWGAASDDVFAVGQGGAILHSDGTGWTAMASGVTSPSFTFFDVWGSRHDGVDDVFVVGNTGDPSVVLRGDGTSWSAFPMMPRTGLDAIWGSRFDDVFAVGNHGAIVHFDGSTWTTMDSTTNSHFFDVWGSGPADVYAVGDFGTIVHFDGQAWNTLASGTTRDLLAVGGTGAGDVFVLGDDVLLHRRAGTWDAIAVPPTVGALRELWSDAGQVFVVGAGGVARLDRAVTCTGPEVNCNDGWDNDCDGLVDAADPDCGGKVAEQCANLVDDDGDGLVDCDDVDDCGRFPSCRHR